MATLTERGGRWTAQVRKKGFKSRAATFATKAEANSWANAIEARMDQERHDRMLRVPEAVENFPLDIAMLPRYPREQIACGVYFLFKGHECVYVGQSKQVHWRVREHTSARHGNKDFDSYAWIPVKPSRLDAAELFYIRMLQPRLNDRSTEMAKLINRVQHPNLTARQRSQALRRLRDAQRSRRNVLHPSHTTFSDC
jgi:hypothetical protein